MPDQSSDILGKPALSIPPIARVKKASSFTILIWGISVFIFIFSLLLALRVARNSLLKWRERRYRLATRRRYGIPDSDRRPFTVAHAAVLRAARDREALEKQMRPPSPPVRKTLSDDQTVRRRHHDDGYSITMPANPQTNTRPSRNFSDPSASFRLPGALPMDPLNFAERYNPNTTVSTSATLDVQYPPIRYHKSSPPLKPCRKDSNSKAKLNEDSRKRSLDAEGGLVPVKKLRFEDEESVHDKTRHSAGQKDQDHHVERESRRNAKRALGDDDAETKQTRDKRPRKHLTNHASIEAMDVDNEIIAKDDKIEADDASELPSIRGKKRDRAEAGRDDLSSVVGGEDERTKRTKRRTLTKTKLDQHLRGRKRDRSTASHESEDEKDGEIPRSRKKRGKTFSVDGDHQESDVLMQGTTSQDTRKERQIGELWEEDGVHYKIDTNGDTLRLTVVKKPRSKFVMPKESQYPDLQTGFDLFVEVWLTIEEYELARDQQQLAWQEISKRLTDSNALDSLTDAGKGLLWIGKSEDSSATLPQINATPPGIRLSPSQQSPTASSRRVASIFTGSPKSGYRSFSKWEKQDLEAEAMKKLRMQREAAKQEKLSESCSGSSMAAPNTATTPSSPSLPKPEENSVPIMQDETASTFPSVVPPAPADTNKPVDSATTAAAAQPPSFLPPTLDTANPLLSQPTNAAPTGVDAGENARASPTSSAIPTFTITPPTAKPPTTPAPAFATNASSDSHLPNPFMRVPTTLLDPDPEPMEPDTLPKPDIKTPTSGKTPSVFSLDQQPNKTPANAFGAPPSNAPKKSEQTIGSTENGTPLSERIGGFVTPQGPGLAATASSSTPFLAKPATSFMTTQTPKSSAVFTSTTPTAPPPVAGNVAPAPATGAGGTGPKFDFGVTKKTSSDAPATQSSASNALPRSDATSFSVTPTKPAVSSKPAGVTGNSGPSVSPWSAFTTPSRNQDASSIQSSKQAEAPGNNAPSVSPWLPSGSAFATSSGNQGASSIQSSKPGDILGGSGPSVSPWLPSGSAFATSSGNPSASSNPTNSFSTVAATKPAFGGFGGNAGGAGAFSAFASTAPSSFGSGGNTFGSFGSAAGSGFGSGNKTNGAARSGRNLTFTNAASLANKPATTNPVFSNTSMAPPSSKPATTNSTSVFGTPSSSSGAADPPRGIFGGVGNSSTTPSAPPVESRPKIRLSHHRYVNAPRPSFDFNNRKPIPIFGQPGLSAPSPLSMGFSSSSTPSSTPSSTNVFPAFPTSTGQQQQPQPQQHQQPPQQQQ